LLTIGLQDILGKYDIGIFRRALIRVSLTYVYDTIVVSGVRQQNVALATCAPCAFGIGVWEVDGPSVSMSLRRKDSQGVREHPHVRQPVGVENLMDVEIQAVTDNKQVHRSFSAEPHKVVEGLVNDVLADKLPSRFEVDRTHGFDATPETVSR
jgi:hypothetical protein